MFENVLCVPCTKVQGRQEQEVKKEDQTPALFRANQNQTSALFRANQQYIDKEILNVLSMKVDCMKLSSSIYLYVIPFHIEL